MQTKITAFTFILLASVVLLAHAVIPHHHHDARICLENLTSSNKSSYHHNPENQNQDKNESQSATTCILNQLVVLPSIQSREFGDCAVSDMNHPEHSHFFLTWFHSAQEINKIVLHQKKHIPAGSPLISVYLNSKIGLRAPPTV